MLGGDVMVFLWGLVGGQVSALNDQLASQTMTTHPSHPAHMGQLVLQRENVFMAQDTCPSTPKGTDQLAMDAFYSSQMLEII